ncbi:MAG TPA: peptidylprolyl isomerase [Terriglobales bacterium]|nr:peptidylprolyl isomerase [Terriglobales bacterium]
MKKKQLLCVCACLATLPAFLKADTVVEEIIARVNNAIITRSDFERSKLQLKDEAKQQDPSNAEKDVAEKERDVLRDLIDQQLLIDKGKDLGLSADTELIKKLDEMRKQMNLESLDDLEKAAQAQGISYEDFKQNMRNQIITQQVIGREVGGHLNISKDEEQKFYEEHKSEMEQPEQIRLSEILVSTTKPSSITPVAKPDPAAPAVPEAAKPVETPTTPPLAAPPAGDDLAAAEAKANSLREGIQKGASFDDVAKKSSDGPSAAQGGDLGLFKRGTLSKELEDRTFAMKAGEITDVIRTKQGFVILKVTEHQQAGVPTMKQMEPRIQDALYYQKLQPALRAYLKKLREEAFIDVRSGYVDTGASPNQTKPVETPGKEAGAKNLKKKKKLGIFK